jgi:hypothetical protein
MLKVGGLVLESWVGVGKDWNGIGTEAVDADEEKKCDKGGRAGLLIDFWSL